MSLLLLSGHVMAADSLFVKQYLLQGPYSVVKPIIVDDVNVKGDSFNNSSLLNGTVNFIAADNKTVTTDASNRLTLTASTSKEANISLASFFMIPEQFCEGTLVVEGKGLFQIFQNGKKVGEQTTSSTSPVKVKLNLMPIQYQFAIKVLGENNTPDIKVCFVPSKGFEKNTVSISTDTKRPLTINDIIEGKRIGSMSLSPNGQYALINYSQVLPGGETQRYTELKDITSNRIILSDPRQSVNYSWLPKSNKLYYTRKGIVGTELVTVDPATLTETILSNNLPEGSFRFAPNESFLLFSIVEKGPANEGAMQEILTPADRQQGWRNRYFIHKFDLNTGNLQRLTYGYKTTALNDVHPNSSKLLFSVRTDKLTERPFSESALYELDLNTMQVDTIWKNQKFAGGAQYSPDGKQLLISASAEAFDQIGKNVSKGAIVNTYDGQLFIMNLSDKKVEPITKNFNPAVSNAEWNNFDKNIYFTAEDQAYVGAFKYDTQKKEIEKLPVKEDVLSIFTQAAAAPVALYAGQSVSNAANGYILDTKNNESKQLVDLSSERLKDVKLGEVKDWTFKSKQGVTIDGRFYLPPNFDPSKKYPMIVYYYGGTSPTSRTFESRYPLHVYAALGYVVYTINPSGTTGYGQDFAAKHVNAWGKTTADDIIDGTKKFCEEHRFVDKTKIGCIGASYGGFMTQYLQTRTDIFAAAISHAGISSISSYWGEGYWGYAYSSAASANSYPWNNPKLYVEQSPLFNADKVKTPILFLHGSVDTNVPVGESIQMFTALKLLGKETAFIQVEGEDHAIQAYQKRLDWNYAIFAWFAKWLQQEPEWWNSLYPKKNL